MGVAVGTVASVSPASHPLPTLIDAELVLRPSRPDDVEPITALLRHPDLRLWWGENSVQSVTEELVGAWVIEIDSEAAGIVECHEEAEPMYPSVAFDIALAAHLHGRHLGRRALWLAIQYFRERGHHRFTIDPAVANQRACRCYRAVGFRDVGILQAAERAPDGSWRDALLMELVLWPGDSLGD